MNAKIDKSGANHHQETPKTDLPQGVRMLRSGKFAATTNWGGKTRHIGTFDTPKQASAAYLSVRSDLVHVNVTTLGADGVGDAFNAAKQKGLESFGGFVPEKRDLPCGISKTPAGKFEAVVCLRGKDRYVGVFDTPEQAFAARMSVKKDLDNVNLSAVGADELDVMFGAAQKKAAIAVGGVVPKKIKSRSERCLPRGVYKTTSEKFASVIWWDNKQRHIGVFNTPEQASAAYMSVKKELAGAKLSAVGAE